MSDSNSVPMKMAVSHIGGLKYRRRRCPRRYVLAEVVRLFISYDLCPIEVGIVHGGQRELEYRIHLLPLCLCLSAVWFNIKALLKSSKMDVEKKAPLEEVDIGDESAQLYDGKLEDEKRVRWKVDMAVLPMVCSFPREISESVFDES